MEINHPWIFTFGAGILGFMVPEFLTQFSKIEVPIGQNILCTLAFVLISAGLFA